MKRSWGKPVHIISFIRTLLITLSVGVCLATLMGCGNKPEKDASPLGDRSPADNIETLREAAAPAVTGTIRGTQVKMTGAKLDRIGLGIFEGTHWAFSPSLRIFFFGKFTGDPAGRTMEVKADVGTGMRAHVHYRWKNPDTDKLDLAFREFCKVR